DGSNTTFGPDFFDIFVDGTRRFREAIPNAGRTPDVSGTNLGFSGFNDAIYRNVTLAFTATAATTQIRFADGGLQGLNDDSWGIHTFRAEPAVAEALNLTGQAVGKFTGQPALFQFQASAGNVLVLTTTTPGGGPGEPVNTLDPRLTLMGPTGAT